MNDPKGLFDHEQTPFETMFGKWSKQLHKNELYQKLTSDKFNINDLYTEQVSQITPVHR